MEKNKEEFGYLPLSWEAINLKTYNRIVNVLPSKEDLTPSEEIDIAITLLASLMNVHKEVIEKMSTNKVMGLMGNLEFLKEKPKFIEPSFKLMKFNEIPYKNFMLYQTIMANTVDKNSIDIALILTCFTELSKEELKEKPIGEILKGFFLLKTQLVKYMLLSLISLAWNNLKMTVKKIFNRNKIRVL